SRTAQFIFEARGGIATSSAVNVRDGNWHMITVMYDADAKQRRTYVDGANMTSGALDLSTYAYLTNNAAVQYGGRETETSLNGMVDEARIYSYPLSANEVADLYYRTRGTFCQARPIYDYDNNCVEDIGDLAVIAATWLECGMYPESSCQ
ncbi:MAG: LamG domain-containing protein, partial [Planctomycetaceae bacterium]|nr:LamG domain-containing protein [Planctomycetaceae bacterium]